MTLPAIDWPRLNKSLFAVFIGSWVGTPLFVVVSGLIGMGGRLGAGELWHGILSVVHLVFSPLGVIAFIPMCVVGLPTQALLQRAGKTGYVWNVIPAIVSGAIFFPLLLIGLGALAKGGFTLENMAMGGLAGLLVGSIAWLVRRPDKDEAPEALPDAA